MFVHSISTPVGSGWEFYYHYDAAGRLVRVNDDEDYPDGTLYVTYQYNSLGQRTSRIYANNSYTTYQYLDEINWLNSVVNSESDDTTISSFAYDDFDLVGNREKITFTNGDYVQYGYDDRYQLTSEERKTSGDSQIYKKSFVYDDAGNRTYLYSGSVGSSDYTAYTYNAANQLKTEALYEDDSLQQTTTYAYDGEGNMDTKTIGGNTWDYDYNEENYLTSFDDPLDSTKDADYIIDARGRRVKKVLDPSGTPMTVKYFHDGADVVLDYTSAETISTTYLTPFLDENVMMTVQGSPDVDYYFYHDGLGSVRNIYNASEASTNTYDYYAFGSQYNWSTSIDNRYTYTGREWDSESSTYYYRARQYHPVLGRFGQADPQPQVNLYVYVMNTPVIFTDPFGAQETEKEETEEENVCCAEKVEVIPATKTMRKNMARGKAWWTGPKQLVPLVAKVKFKVTGRNLSLCKLRQKVTVQMVIEGGKPRQKLSGQAVENWMQGWYSNEKGRKFIMGVSDFKVGSPMQDWVTRKLKADLAEAKWISKEYPEVVIAPKTGCDTWKIPLPNENSVYATKKDGKWIIPDSKADWKFYSTPAFGAVAMKIETYVVDKNDASDKAICSTTSYYYWKSYGVRTVPPNLTNADPSSWLNTVSNPANFSIFRMRASRIPAEGRVVLNHK